MTCYKFFSGNSAKTLDAFRDKRWDTLRFQSFHHLNIADRTASLSSFFIIIASLQSKTN